MQGGTVAILCAMERPHFFTGVVLSAPAIMANPKTASRGMVSILTNDPLAWKGGLKAKWAMAIHDAMEVIKGNLTKIEWPFLVLHGDADQLTMVEGSVMLEEKAASKDKTIKIYPGFYHKLLNEPKDDAALVMNDIISWINQRLPS
ncbi:monoglyceride lipase-like isoform X2 [Stylophora pistillata]|uniref:monoglyceride lipase-like isoform X2 n=1 Tax=Stylophora pistillata TaxID=50429 RepID=UPI000C043D7E|nr:monoglyceride lipase-like isoform X2 [Stylophora pistillata]